MTIQYQQNNINQDGDVKNIVFEDAAEPIDLSGAGGGVAFVEIQGGLVLNVTLNLPLAREAGKNAEVTVILAASDQQPSTVAIGTQTDSDGNQDNIRDGWGGNDPLTLGVVATSLWSNTTFSSDGLDTWTVTATTVG